MIRLFVALDLSDENKEKIKLIGEKLNLPDAKLVPFSNLHITLKFIGYVENNLIETIETITNEVAKEHMKMQIVLDRLGAFPSRKRGRIFWVGSRKNEALSGLVDDLNEAFKKIGIEPEKRSFKAHLTVARLKKPENLVQFIEDPFEQLTQEIGHLVLFESKLSPKGAQYKPIKKFNLKSA